jgi:hypothetical protein
MSRNSVLFSAGVTALAFFSHRAGAAEAQGEAVKVTQGKESVRVEINGELFTEYFFTGKSHPWVAPGKGPEAGAGEARTNWPMHVYYYPVLGPGGAAMTRDWPMKVVASEEHDHPHHRSLWYSHGAVNGIDFWGEGTKSGRIVHDKFLEVKGGAESGVIRSTCKWIGPDNQVVCTDERTFRVYARPNSERLFDFDITLKALDKEVVFGDTKEGSMGIRVAESMRLTHPKNKPGPGHIVQSTGLRDDKTWGKPADWCDYYGPVNGKTVGIAMFDHASNPRHPTTWHVRDYGLFAANPFGLHDFDKRPAGTGNLTIPPRQSVTFKYRVYLHEGDEKQAQVAERYKEYVAEGK